MNFSKDFITQIATSDFCKKLQAGELTMDNSEFTTWDGCMVSGLYGGILKRMNARGRSPLAFGAAVHSGLEAYFKRDGQWRERALETAAVEKLDELGDPKRNSGKLMDILEAYVLEYERNPYMQFELIELDGVRQVEKPFIVPLGKLDLVTRTWGSLTGININWSGKIDLFTLYDGGIWPVDHKTTSIMGEKFIDDKVRSSQFLGYTFAARYLSEQLFGNLRVGGCRVNALAMRSAGYEFKSFDIPYADWKIAEWQLETMVRLKDMILQVDNFIQTGVMPPTRQHCVSKYGKCPYFDLCECPVTMRDRMVFDDSYFYKSDWSPLGE